MLPRVFLLPKEAPKRVLSLNPPFLVRVKDAEAFVLTVDFPTLLTLDIEPLPDRNDILLLGVG
jgi:hypothetical protein